MIQKDLKIQVGELLAGGSSCKKCFRDGFIGSYLLSLNCSVTWGDRMVHFMLV